MTGGLEPGDFDRELADFSQRVKALRSARGQSPDIVDALVLELDLAEHMRLGRGDALLLYSDGVTERRGANDALYGSAPAGGGPHPQR